MPIVELIGRQVLRTKREESSGKVVGNARFAVVSM